MKNPLGQVKFVCLFNVTMATFTRERYRPLLHRSDFWNGKVDRSHGAGPLSYQFWDLFTRVRYRTVPKHFAPKQAKENLICQQISNTAE